MNSVSDRVKIVPERELDRVREYAGKDADPDFVVWLNEVDGLVQEKIELSVFDLGDMMFYDSYEAGDSPRDFVREVVAEELRNEYGEEYAELLLGDREDDYA